MVKKLIRPQGHADPAPPKQVAKQVFPIHYFSKPFTRKAFSPPGPLTVDQWVALSSFVGVLRRFTNKDSMAIA